MPVSNPSSHDRAASARGATDAPLRTAAFFTVTYVEIVQPCAAQGAALLGEYRDASRENQGAVRFELMQRLERPNQFAVLAAWENQNAFEGHIGEPHLMQLSQNLAPMLAAPNDTRQHSGLALGDARRSRRASITVVTHVDVIPQHKDDGAVALTQLAEDSRKHGGNLRFDVWQQANRPNHFTVVETWASRRTFDSHGAAAQTRDFRTKLAPMSGALYDERLYKPLH